jgi:hypothetical protein
MEGSTKEVRAGASALFYLAMFDGLIRVPYEDKVTFNSSGVCLALQLKVVNTAFQ